MTDPAEFIKECRERAEKASYGRRNEWSEREYFEDVPRLCDLLEQALARAAQERAHDSKCESNFCSLAGGVEPI